MTLKLFNTLTREKEEFKTLEEGKVKFYSCGQTIYDDLHIGNARAYIAWDTLRRYLEWKGYIVRHVQNITDVGHLTDEGDQGEDKVEKRAKEMDLEPMELVENQIERYFEDTKALNIERQDIVPRATGHINEMIKYIEGIIEDGYAYEADGNIYFDVDAFAEDYDYGEIANKDQEQLEEEAESRVEPDPNKKNQYDFALWIKADDSHLMKWESPWSTGYPGWHLECSVMSQKYLGNRFDIHTGGKDHIFPHHPNERAQCLAATGEPQANYWLHNEFINIEGEKMSKSEGNFYTVRELLDEGYSGNSLRLYINSSHYRSETNFSKDGIEKAEKELKRIRKTFQRLKDYENTKKDDKYLKRLDSKFEEFMDDDLNTAKAKQFLMKKVKEVNRKMDSGEPLDASLTEKFEELFKVLGVDIKPEATDNEIELGEILLELRENARNSKDYETADYIRDRLEEMGYSIEDSNQGSKILY